MTFASQLQQLDACPEAIKWVGNKSRYNAWRSCKRSDWLLWLAATVGVDRKLIVLAACDCAELADEYLDDATRKLARKAIATARSWCRGDATVPQVRKAADASASAGAADASAGAAGAAAALAAGAAAYADAYADALAAAAADAAAYADALAAAAADAAAYADADASADAGAYADAAGAAAALAAAYASSSSSAYADASAYAGAAADAAAAAAYAAAFNTDAAYSDALAVCAKLVRKRISYSAIKAAMDGGK